MRHIPTAIILLIMLLACDKKSIEKTGNSQAEIFSINPGGATSKGFEEIYTNLKFLKLETSKQNIIGNITNMLVSTDNIFIQDDKGVYIFNHFGDFISKLTKKGDGPGEYNGFKAVYIDTLKNTIEVLDHQSRKILLYDFNGEYIEEESIPIFPLSFTRKGTDYYFFNGNQYMPEFPSSYCSAVIRPEFQITSTYFPVDKTKSRYLHIQFNNDFYYYQDTVRFYKPLTDTIYSIVKNIPEARFIIDFAGKNVPEDIYSVPYANIQEFYINLIKKGYAYNVNNVLETRAHLVFTYYVAGSPIQVQLNKNTKKITQVNNWRASFLGGKKIPTSYYMPMSIYNDTFYGYIESYDLVATLDSLGRNMNAEDWQEFTSDYRDLYDLYRDLKIDDNPIIFSYTLR